MEETLGVQFPRVFDSFSKKLCHLSIQSRGRLSIAKPSAEVTLELPGTLLHRHPGTALGRSTPLSPSTSIPISRWLHVAVGSSTLELSCPPGGMWSCWASLARWFCPGRAVVPPTTQAFKRTPGCSFKTQSNSAIRSVHLHQAAVVINFG